MKKAWTCLNCPEQDVYKYTPCYCRCACSIYLTPRSHHHIQYPHIREHTTTNTPSPDHHQLWSVAGNTRGCVIAPGRWFLLTGLKFTPFLLIILINRTDIHVHVLAHTCLHIYSACTHIHVHMYKTYYIYK